MIKKSEFAELVTVEPKNYITDNTFVKWIAFGPGLKYKFNSFKLGSKLSNLISKKLKKTSYSDCKTEKN